LTDQPGQESRGGESGPGTDPMASVPPEQQNQRRGLGSGQGQGPGPGSGDRSGLWALWLGGGALLLMFFLPPISLALAVAALYLGIRTRRRARRAGTAVRGAVAGIVLGSIGLGLSAILVTTQIIFWNELNRYLVCQDAANTIADEAGCREAFYRDVERKFNLREGSLRRYDLPI
jgi:hypothetical protein